MKQIFLSAILAAAGFIGTSMPASAQVPPPGTVFVPNAPPAPMTMAMPPRPGGGMVWVGGYWRWTGTRYVWVSGRWTRHGGAWCAGRWRSSPRGWWWTAGRWC